MVGAMAARTVDAMVNVEPCNVIAEADRIGVDIRDPASTGCRRSWRRPAEFVDRSPATVVAYLMAKARAGA